MAAALSLALSVGAAWATGGGASGEAASAGGSGPAASAAATPASPAQDFPNVEYDGRFTFVRVRFDDGSGSLRSFGRRGRGGGPLWSHDYPYGERNFLKILNETTLLGPNMEGSNILSLDDPELFRYPLAYIVEVGYWQPSEEEVEALRSYLEKGGFLIVDDFRGPWELANFEQQIRRVLPGHQLREIDATAEIFDSFFAIESLDLAPPTFQGLEPIYLAVHEDDDPRKRVMIIVNYNNDMGEYWEYSDLGYYPIDLSNEAYKLGVNYVIYAHTH